MTIHNKGIHSIAYGLIALLMYLFCLAPSFSQAEELTPAVLRVGISAAPPLFMKNADGQWEGFSIELWQAVAKLLGKPYQLREFSKWEELLDALGKKEIDVIPSLAVNEHYESSVDFSNSYLKSGLAIAVPAEGYEMQWIRIFKSILSTDMLNAVGFLFLLSLVSGTVVWGFERRCNSEMFGDGPLGGIGHSIWWAVVTMTTVGYGDKAPRTIGGRITAMIWMLFSLILIASFTANITASLTIGELRGQVHGFNDLYRVRVGSIPNSEAFNSLVNKGISVIPVQDLQEGLQKVSEKKIDALVLNEQILKYLSKRDFPGQVQILPEIFDEYYVSIALQNSSQLRKPINKALLKFMNTKEWVELRNHYLQ
jgi:polar amino acid transport system substrate-binding protein